MKDPLPSEEMNTPIYKKVYHYLFKCPTFWKIKPAFKCPLCRKKYRCYWDGNDDFGIINICDECVKRKKTA